MHSLNGTWTYQVGNGKQTEISVPFSKLPVGYSVCTKTFDLQENADTVLLRFDGITYGATVWLGGNLLGEMLPYSEYTFDITAFVKPTDNLLRVELEDIVPVFGPSEGWENYGGIIRDVSVLYKPKNYITDVFFKSTLINDYADATLTVEATAVEADSTFRVTLYDGDTVVTSYEQGEKAVKATVNGVKLWSPETPHLYRLEVSLLENGVPQDVYTHSVGFREFVCDDHHFLLNGKPLFLKGVCKHEMFGDSGHCPTEEQMRFDMQMIKETGCNFVRLVHYPHHKKILDIADELGLMVSEEPGLWWSDTANPQVQAGSLEVLRRTVLRDRNHPSIVFWLSFNECRFTEAFLVESARVCRRYDPTRLVSGANCMNNEDTLKFYNKCGFDFYTMHPYAQTVDRAKESAAILNDKPLLFTEWGGYYVYNNPKLLGEFLDEFYRLYEQGALAGAFFWEWSELNDFNRNDGACVDGVLREGLVDTYRNPTLIFDSFTAALERMGKPAAVPQFWIEECEPINGENLLTADGDKTALKEAVAATYALENEGKKLMRKRVVKEGPVLHNVNGLLGIPLTLRDGDTVTVNVNKTTDALTFIGMVSAHKGYPLCGAYGEEVAILTVTFADGSSETVTFKNGVDVTTVFETNGSSRIDPIAENAARIATFGYDKNFERYILNKRTVPPEGGKTVHSITLRSADNGYALLLYGIY